MESFGKSVVHTSTCHQSPVTCIILSQEASGGFEISRSIAGLEMFTRPKAYNITTGIRDLIEIQWLIEKEKGCVRIVLMWRLRDVMRDTSLHLEI